eukprot:1766910-Amphidinium_carterae.1
MCAWICGGARGWPSLGVDLARWCRGAVVFLRHGDILPSIRKGYIVHLTKCHGFSARMHRGHVVPGNPRCRPRFAGGAKATAICSSPVVKPSGGVPTKLLGPHFTLL